MSNRTALHATARSNLVVNDGNWHYACGTTSPEQVYVDGVLQSSTDSESWSFEPNAKIGTKGTAQYFNGSIDEVRIWNRTLTQAEIKNEMNSSLPVVRPLASYSFEESGSYVNDTHIWVNGTYGSALSFDGVDDYVRVLDSNSLDITNAITISAWVYPTSWSSTHSRIVSKESDITANPYALELDSSGNRTMFCLNVGSGENCLAFSETNSISLDNWHYITGTWNGTHSQIYINGTLKSTNPLTGVMSASTNNVLIGNNPSNNRQFNGTIDEVRIWSRALNSTEINAEMNKG
jgi:hypothetical protein